MKTQSVLMAAAIAVAVPGIGCTHVAKTRANTEMRLAEHSRTYTAAVVDALQLQPTERRDAFTQAALDFAEEDQRIEGLPAEPVEVAQLLGVNTNLPPEVVAQQREKARRDLAERTAEVRALVAKERRAEDRLLAFGERYEAARNEQRVTWLKRGTTLTLILAGFVVLAISFPAAVPLAGRVLAWLVGKIPALAGSVGVVSVKAFDAVVKGIEQTRTANVSGERFGNHVGQVPAVAMQGDLNANLSREMDAAHKALVRQRKTALKLQS
jgi:hypothetical protein